MAVGMRSCEELGRLDIGPSLRTRVNGWRIALAAGCLVASLIARTPVEADEFDPLVAYEEARVLNDQWQACAASFVRKRLRSQQTAERLAERALDRCRVRQSRLSRFLTGRIGRKEASSVMALLREKYRSGLVAAIMELRARD
ncbi:hypothetical protein [Microvirga sp. KLBC 81]|uniref:hypothetical protein n=1 Tax=Microvirga sp. KLBC 81 TaxID=1862707 RepID=UPI001058342D|nr:hypothetical protein [Microvirga sp. KLBC 81]